MNSRIKQDTLDVWTAGTNETPVWRDGLTTTLTYLLIAVKKKAEEYNCVCVRRLGQSLYKVKFYPSMDYWHLSEEKLSEMGFQNYLSRKDTNQYERMTADTHRSMERLTNHLEKLRQTNSVPAQKYFPILRTGEGQQTSVVLHPKRGGAAATNPQ